MVNKNSNNNKIRKGMEKFAEDSACEAKRIILEQNKKIEMEISKGKHEHLIGLLKSRFDVYFTKGTFHSNRLSVDICFSEFNWDKMEGVDRGFLVINDKDEEIYRYIDGVWKNDGEIFIRYIVAAVLKDKCTNKRQNEVINYVRSIWSLRKERDVLNGNINLINMRNGVFDISTGELIPHDRKYYFINKLNIEYDKNADCEMVKNFINEIHYKEDIIVIQELFGYLLYRDFPFHILVLCVGNGENGKSTELNLMKYFIGLENTVSIPLQQLTEDVFARASLFGKLANISGDIGSADIGDTGLLKELTGGDASISAQHKFGHRFEFRNRTKLIYSCNQLPRFIKDDSDALWRRILFFNFPNKFPIGTPSCDPNLLEKLITSKELSGLFNWAMDGLQRLLKQKKFSYSRSCDENRNAYRRLADHVLAFSEDFIVFESDWDAYLDKDDVYKKYADWCRENKYSVLPMHIFTLRLKNAIPGCVQSRIRNGDRLIQGYRYVKWKDGSQNIYRHSPIDETSISSENQKLPISTNLVDEESNEQKDLAKEYGDDDGEEKKDS